MEYTFVLEHEYIYLPVAAKQPKILLEILADGEKRMELRMPFTSSEAAQYDFYAPVRLSGLKGREVTLKGEFTESYAGLIRQSDDFLDKNNPVQAEKARKDAPRIHFHPESGWINDPNGLVYRDGIYHLYYQHNPLDTEWDNMSWGHAVSRDLLCWEEQPAVMYPDRDGMIFSGCGICNDFGLLGLPREALLFFYTAAGGTTPWSEGKSFVQKLAYSLDGGTTLVKSADWVMDTLCRENRDPKIFWYEPAGEYVMVLWLEENDFGIFVSSDLERFEMTDRLTFEEAWECPDLLKLHVEGSGEEAWIFWSADGFYYPGVFDGRKFWAQGNRQKAYGTKLPYAAQTYSGVQGRVISVPWLRTHNSGRNFRGVMGLPRELSLIRTTEGLRLSQKPVREWDERKRLVFARENTLCAGFLKTSSSPVEVHVSLEGCMEATLKILSETVRFCRREGMVYAGRETAGCPEGMTGLRVIVDGEVIEIVDDSGIMNVILERGESCMEGRIGLTSDGLSGIHIYEG